LNLLIYGYFDEAPIRGHAVAGAGKR
jgi:hypothetical protein